MSIVNQLLARGIYLVLSPWQYKVALGDTDITYKGQAIQPEDFAAFWGEFAVRINVLVTHPDRVASI